MSAAATISPADRSRVGPALAELCAGHDELDRSLAQCFTELDALAAGLVGHQEVSLAGCRGTESGTSDAALQGQLREWERQRAAWERERGVLENELETVRARAAESAELLAQQKRQMAEQQAQWMEELKRMRRLLEAMARRLCEPDEASATHVPQRAAAGAGEPAGDPVLDSVMAQFERLQKDLVRRRPK